MSAQVRQRHRMTTIEDAPVEMTTSVSRLAAIVRPELARQEDTATSSRLAAEVRPQIAPTGLTLAKQRSDAAIERLARTQHYVVTLAQLEALGLSGRAVRHRVAAGRLHRLHRGVYAPGRPSERGRWMAAVLVSGEGALLSHRSAAALWDLRADSRSKIDVTIQGSTGRVRTLIDVHSGAQIAPSDIALHHGIPCTSVARTLLDLGGVVDRRALERALDRADELRRFDRKALAEVLARCPRRRGARSLRAVLDEDAGPAATRSVAEERFLVAIQDAGLPRPEVNRWIPLEGSSGYRPDFLWPDVRLIVEVDSRTHHARRTAFRHDRQRDRRLALAGFETRRYGATEIVDDPAKVISEPRAFLGL